MAWELDLEKNKRLTARTIEVVADARKALIAKKLKTTAEIVQDWVSVSDEVVATSIEQDARDRRRLFGAPRTEGDQLFNAWFSVYAALESKACLSVGEREKFRESSDIKGLKEGIALCEALIEGRQSLIDASHAQRMRDGTSPNISAEGGEFE
jgi:hypothetical protein